MLDGVAVFLGAFHRSRLAIEQRTCHCGIAGRRAARIRRSSAILTIAFHRGRSREQRVAQGWQSSVRGTRSCEIARAGDIRFRAQCRTTCPDAHRVLRTRNRCARARRRAATPRARGRECASAGRARRASRCVRPRTRRTRVGRRAGELQDRFLSTVSHELRTPLNAIVGWAHVLKTGTLSEAQSSRAIDGIERNAHAQSKLISDLLDISQLIRGRLPVKHGRD